MADDTDRTPIVTSYVDLDMVTHRPTRDALRRAVADTAHDPVWITENGTRIAAIVSPQMAEAATAIIAYRATPGTDPCLTWLATGESRQYEGHWVALDAETGAFLGLADDIRAWRVKQARGALMIFVDPLGS